MDRIGAGQGHARRSGLPSRAAGFFRRFVLFQALSILATLVLAAALVFADELVARGSLRSTIDFFSLPYRPGWTTVALFAVLLLLLDAVLGRAHLGVLILGPVVLLLAFVGWQKAFYLGDPLFPTDFLFARQVVEIFPLLARQRPFAAVGLCVAVVLGLVLLGWGWWFMRRRLPRLRVGNRLLRTAAALPALLLFASFTDYASYSWARDRLHIFPLMYDQKENYAWNGFAIAFALNVPMAKVSAPDGYGSAAIDAIPAPEAKVGLPAERPDIVVVMSESHWDPLRLPNVSVTPDPEPATRANLSGHIFSPEFGGLTANVEFEALTGFSNAFLPTGSLPYQQYIRGSMPTLPGFLRSQGYETLALHPNVDWFWNRRNVYRDFGFDRFLSIETMPGLAHRGPLVSDAAMTDRIIAQADAAAKPLFLFAVSMQNHGAYEPNRYSDPTHTVRGTLRYPDGQPVLTDANAQSLLTYVEGVSDADRGLARLLDWAGKRKRPTIVAFFGDHLPPLGWVYVDARFMNDTVAPRREPLADLLPHHETPLAIWSNRTGPVRGVGTVSPSFLPLLLLREAGVTHPYYTGLLGAVHDRFRVIDRHALVKPDGTGDIDWLRAGAADPSITNLHLLQYDILFGDRFGQDRFFPALPANGPHTS